MAKDADEPLLFWVVLSCPVLSRFRVPWFWRRVVGWLGDVRADGGEAVEPSSKKRAKTLKKVGRFCVVLTNLNGDDNDNRALKNECGVI